MFKTKYLFIATLFYVVVLSLSGQVSYEDQPSTGSTSGHYYLGHCSYREPTKENGLTYDKQVTLHLFARVQKEQLRPFIDSKVIGVRIAVLQPIEVDAFLQDGIKGKILKTKKQTLQPGWNEVLFDTPFTISDNEICFGYDHQVENDHFLNIKPTYAVDKESKSNIDGYYFSIKGSDYVQNCAIDYGNLMVQLILKETPNEVDYKASLVELKMPRVKDPDGTSSFNVCIQNIGAKQIDEMVLSYQINDEPFQEVHLKASLATQAIRNIKISGVNASKYDMLHVKLVSINGKTIEGYENTTLKDEFLMAEKSYPKRVLMEHFTTESCGNCPRVEHELSRWIYDSKEGYKDKIVWVAHHVGYETDFLTLPESKNLLFMYKSPQTYAPGIALDRTKTDLYGKKYKKAFVLPLIDDPEPFIPFLKSAISSPAPMSIELKADYDDANKNIKVTVTGEYEPLDIDISSCKIHLWIVESGILPKKQAGTAKYPDFIHNNVLRYVHKSINGFDFSFNKTNNTYSAIENLPMKESWDFDHCKIVVFISMPISESAKEITVYNANQILLGTGMNCDRIDENINTPIIEFVNGKLKVAGEDKAEIKIYSPEGIYVQNDNLSSGIYIVKIRINNKWSVHKKYIL